MGYDDRDSSGIAMAAVAAVAVLLLFIVIGGGFVVYRSLIVSRQEAAELQRARAAEAMAREQALIAARTARENELAEAAADLEDAGLAVLASDLSPGDAVQAELGDQWFPVNVVAVEPSGTVRIRYEDGREEVLFPERLRRPPPDEAAEELQDSVSGGTG